MAVGRQLIQSGGVRRVRRVRRHHRLPGQPGADCIRLAAIARLTCAYATVFGFGVLPLLYMGDERGMVNDLSCLDDPAKVADNRWVHRSAVDWTDRGEVALRVLAAMRCLISARTSLPALHASVGTECVATSTPAVLVLPRQHAAGNIVQVHNLSEAPQVFEMAALRPLSDDRLTDHLSGDVFEV